MDTGGRQQQCRAEQASRAQAIERIIPAGPMTASQSMSDLDLGKSNRARLSSLAFEQARPIRHLLEPG